MGGDDGASLYLPGCIVGIVADPAVRRTWRIAGSAPGLAAGGNRLDGVGYGLSSLCQPEPNISPSCSTTQKCLSSSAQMWAALMPSLSGLRYTQENHVPS